MNATRSLPVTVQRGLDTCARCQEVCLRLATIDCLSWGGNCAKPRECNLLFDCAQLCRMASDFLLRDSARRGEVCRLCAEACETCAEECNTIGDMHECREACEQCAAVCREIAAGPR